MIKQGITDNSDIAYIGPHVTAEELSRNKRKASGTVYFAVSVK